MVAIKKIRPVILCGGSGTRLWPLSRERFPKQFVPLVGEKSLLDLTLLRANRLAPPICICNEEHRFLVQSAIDHHSSDPQQATVILEPAGRNTAPAIAAAAYLPQVVNEELLLFLPADHYVPDVEHFIATISAGVMAARAGYVVTFGAQPIFPSTAYGYIEQGAELNTLRPGDRVHEVKKFIEKPNTVEAQRLFSSGHYLWNMGIFLCEANVLRKALQTHAPDIHMQIKNSMRLAQVDGRFVRPEQELYLACRPDSIDYAVMESFSKMTVIPFTGAWSDVGSWNTLSQLAEPDAGNNRIRGLGYLYSSQNTYIHSSERLVVGVGLQDMVVVDTPDAVLVAHVSCAEEIKKVVGELKEKNFLQDATHEKEYRPWGWFETIVVTKEYKVKRLSVNPGQSLSLQKHQFRSEHWVVVGGVARVTNGEKVFVLNENQSTYIPMGEVHRLENPGEINLEVIEVQLGSYLGDDDIIRIQDFYSRN